MTSFRRNAFLMTPVIVTVGINDASAHPGHSHDGVAGGESHVTLVYVAAMLAILLIASAILYVRSRR